MKGHPSYLKSLIPKGQFTAKEAKLRGSQLRALADMKLIKKVKVESDHSGKRIVWVAI